MANGMLDHDKTHSNLKKKIGSFQQKFSKIYSGSHFIEGTR